MSLRKKILLVLGSILLMGGIIFYQEIGFKILMIYESSLNVSELNKCNMKIGTKEKGELTVNKLSYSGDLLHPQVVYKNLGYYINDFNGKYKDGGYYKGDFEIEYIYYPTLLKTTIFSKYKKYVEEEYKSNLEQMLNGGYIPGCNKYITIKQ